MEFSECGESEIVLFIIIQIVFTLVFFLLFCGRRAYPAEQVTAVDFTGRASLVNERSDKYQRTKKREDKEMKEVLKALKDGGKLALVINPHD